MKKKLVLLLIIVLAVVIPSAVFADTGIGGIGGYNQPTGISFKLDNFPVVSLGWSLSSSWIAGTVDYWFINDKFARNFLWYLGAGAKITIDSTVGLGFRVPVGVQWYFMPRFELFGELVPSFAILPTSGFYLSGGIGLRFHL